MTSGPSRSPMLYAYNMMSNFSKYSSRVYQRTKTEWRELHKQNMSGENHPMYGKKQSKDTIEKRLSNTDREKLRTRKGISPVTKGKTFIEAYGVDKALEISKKKSSSTKGKKKPEGFAKGEKNSNYGKRHPGLNAGEKNHRYGKKGELSATFGMKHSDESKYQQGLKRIKDRIELYTQVVMFLEGGTKTASICEQLGLKEHVVYAIKKGDHTIHEYLRRQNAK